MSVFDEHPLVLEADVLVLFDPVFAGGADRVVNVEDPDHVSFVSFLGQRLLTCISPILPPHPALIRAAASEAAVGETLAKSVNLQEI